MGRATKASKGEEKHVKPGLSWSPECDRLARQLALELSADRCRRVSLGETCLEAMRLLAKKQGVKLS